MAFRFLHAADIHLDSPLRPCATGSRLAELIGNATRQAFTGIIDLCLAEQVDALLLAGDLYDGDQTSMKTARYFAEQLHRLDQAGIRSSSSAATTMRCRASRRSSSSPTRSRSSVAARRPFPSKERLASLAL